MTYAIACADLAEARAVRAQLDAAYHYPKASINLGTGQPVPPGAPGWTASIATILDIGSAAFVMGITPEIAAIVYRLSVDIDRPMGTEYTLEIDHWNGDTPILVERAHPYSEPLGDLGRSKKAALETIAMRSDAARVAGFLHSDGHRYSLEHAALRQVMEAKSWAVYDQEHATSYMAYPLIWPSVDRSGFVAMQNAAAVVAFALACSLADRALTEQMAGLEMSIVLAETADDVAAILGAA